MKKKLVSVIVPVYNVEKYLKRCIDSILAQTYQNLEIIIVDDGSTDASPNLCDEYEKTDHRVRVHHQTNGGLSAARNAGIDLSKGEYITFIDSDDYIHPQMIECLYNDIVENDVMISACGMKRVAQEETYMDVEHEKSECRVYSSKEMFYKLFDEPNWNVSVIVAWSKLYSRELFIECRYPVGKLFEDNYTTPRLLQAAELVAVNERPLYYYRMREGSISNSRNNKIALLDTYDAFESLYTFMRTTEDEQLISKGAMAILKNFYLLNRQLGREKDEENIKILREIYKKVYRDHIRKIPVVGWRVRYGLMRYVPRAYNFALIKAQGIMGNGGIK